MSDRPSTTSKATTSRSTPHSSPSTRRVRLVLLLAITGGGVDAVIYLGFGVLTAAQTGNTIALATSLAQEHFATTLHAVTSVIGYLIGVAVGEVVIVGRDDIIAWLSSLGWIFMIQLLAMGCLLASWYIVGPDPVVSQSMALVALAAIAMGLQSVAVLRLHTGPTTTYVTGTLTTFTARLVRWLHLARIEERLPVAEQRAASANLLSNDGPWFYALTWLFYLVGAAVSGLLFLSFGEFALLLPTATLVTVIAIDHDIR